MKEETPGTKALVGFLVSFFEKYKEAYRAAWEMRKGYPIPPEVDTAYFLGLVLGYRLRLDQEKKRDPEVEKVIKDYLEENRT